MKRVVLIFFSLFWTLFYSAQDKIDKCSTHTYLNELLKNKTFRDQFNKDQAKLKLEEENRQSQLNKAGTVYTIPVVFHVLHNGGPENISYQQVLDALSVLNTDFRKQNQDVNNVVSIFQSIASDIEIDFALATKAPNGQCFSGVTRTQSPLTVAPTNGSFFENGQSQVDAVIAGNDVFQGLWPANKYLNVFICKDIGDGAGYTFNPGGFGTSMYFNSIYMLHNYTGSKGTSQPQFSRTLTHEVGHWLNLSHTWGPNNNPGNASSCNDDDGVNDTPNTIGVTSCNLSESSCGVVANVENYMDYSFCSKMFTTGQRSRMRTSVTSSVVGRNNLWQIANLNETGAIGNLELCKADFSANETVVCSGAQVQFTDNSYHSPTAWSWSFSGGIPSTSTSQNPTVVYNTPGLYEVGLAVSNSGGSVSQNKTQYISVVSENGILPIQESFETTTAIPSNNWFSKSFHNGSSWELTSDAASSGSRSIMIKNTQNAEGSIDELESTTINLDLNITASITFKYAFAEKNNSNSDKLIVKVSSDCGETWNTKKSLSSTSLATGPISTGNFIPDASQWKSTTISSNSLANFLVSDFRMKFIFESGGGNNLYIDDINIDGPVGVRENQLIEKIKLFPNPANEEVNLSFVNLKKQALFSIAVLDVVGKEVGLVHLGEMSIGEQNFVINTSKYSSGVYFISLNNGLQQSIKKIIIE
jgi:PKD repeat protein